MYWRVTGDGENLVIREQALHDMPGLGPWGQQTDIETDNAQFVRRHCILQFLYKYIILQVILLGFRKKFSVLKLAIKERKSVYTSEIIFSVLQMHSPGGSTMYDSGP